MKTLQRQFARFLQEVDSYRLMTVDPRTPRLPRVLLVAAVGYLVSPIDLIPDVIPVLGHLDDVVIVGVLVRIALSLIPRTVREDCRRRAGIQPDAGLQRHKE